MVYMSIDQSLNCSGVFVWLEDGSYEHFLIKPKNKGAEPLIKIRDTIMFLKRLVNRFDVQHIVIESLPYGVNSTSVRPLAALYFFIHNMCIDMDITFSEAIVTSIKKFATGKGNAKKDDMVLAFQEQAPELYKKLEDLKIRKTTGMRDLADAYFIGKLFGSSHEEST